jgi:hypothetical protein
VRAIVAEIPADLGDLPLKHLKGVLSCFPKACSFCLSDDDSLTLEEQDSLTAWLKDRPNSLTRADQQWETVGGFLKLAWRAGVLKTVKKGDLMLEDEGCRDLIIEGFVSGVESITTELSEGGAHVERAALGYLRHFPALKLITLFAPEEDSTLPAFTPSSLEVLTLELWNSEPALLVGSVPRTIDSSGAKLRHLKVVTKSLSDERTSRGLGSLTRPGGPTLQEVDLVVVTWFESGGRGGGGSAGELPASPQFECANRSLCRDAPRWEFHLPPRRIVPLPS